MAKSKKPKSAAVTIRALAHHVGLTPGTVSVVLNDSPSARAIPKETKERIHAAAKELNYHPNFFARSLRNKRTFMIGVIAEEIGDSYGSAVISGIEAHLRKMGYFFLTVAHRHDEDLLSRYSQLADAFRSATWCDRKRKPCESQLPARFWRLFRLQDEDCDKCRTKICLRTCAHIYFQLTPRPG
jgi:hypothetical protein